MLTLLKIFMFCLDLKRDNKNCSFVAAYHNCFKVISLNFQVHAHFTCNGATTIDIALTLSKVSMNKLITSKQLWYTRKELQFLLSRLRSRQNMNILSRVCMNLKIHAYNLETVKRDKENCDSFVAVSSL